MIDQLKGIIIGKVDSYAILDNNGVGFKIYMSKNSLNTLGINNKEVMLKIHLHVKEDILDLYGFLSETERSVFLDLIKVNGIGPKLGLTFLSGMTLDNIIKAIISSDVSLLTTVPGVGLKTAKRIIIELKDKFEKTNTLVINSETDNKIILHNDAMNALSNLGYKEPEIKLAMKKLDYKKSDFSSIQELIKEILKYLK